MMTGDRQQCVQQVKVRIKLGADILCLVIVRGQASPLAVHVGQTGRKGRGRPFLQSQVGSGQHSNLTCRVRIRHAPQKGHSQQQHVRDQAARQLPHPGRDSSCSAASSAVLGTPVQHGDNVPASRAERLLHHA